MAIVGRRVFKTFVRGQSGAAALQIKQIEGWLDLYRLDCNQYPTTDQGLDALLNKPGSGADCPNYDPSGYAEGVTKIPVDPWGTPYQYTCNDGINYEIVSLGADRQPGGEGNNGDISSKDEK